MPWIMPPALLSEGQLYYDMIDRGQLIPAQLMAHCHNSIITANLFVNLIQAQGCPSFIWALHIHHKKLIASKKKVYQWNFFE